MQPAELKPYAAYKDSGVPWLGEAPAHWGVRRGKTLFRPILVRSVPFQWELQVRSKDIINTDSQKSAQ